MKTTTAVEKQPVRPGAVAVLTPAAAALAGASISENTRLAYQSALNRLHQVPGGAHRPAQRRQSRARGGVGEDRDRAGGRGWQPGA